MSKKFLSVGDTLINPDLLAYAVVDGPGPEGVVLRLGFATQTGGRSDLRLVGDQAGEVLRWLRLNADFLSKQSSFHPNSPVQQTSRDHRRTERHLPIHERASTALEREPELVGRY
ncbi:MAG: hypothetical protein P4L85_22925 [Paludisphaera borealis]|uniref:hypothetical protein n=1 Tax=Paludisphaera borealis TaxID=1387353 RepID=UPI0028471DA6|nr:hypothetical protein [Paludisphaera borealis]MDR3622222.1 hypothetical protein [Paludisphaera borealis]